MALLNYQPPISPYLSIVYQDDDIIVLDKPSGLLSVPGKAEEHKDCLQFRVQRVFPTATIVHRLDMATSGLLVMALNMPAHRALSRQFEKRLTAKRYIARIKGLLTEQSGEIEAPLICDWPNRPKQMVDWERGKKALTRFERLAANDVESLVALYPVTGRSHQLRVHCLHIGHAILGDRLYACEEGLKMASRLQLHAESLALNHPITEQRIVFNVKSPFAQVELDSIE